MVTVFLEGRRWVYDDEADAWAPERDDDADEGLTNPADLQAFLNSWYTMARRGHWTTSRHYPYRAERLGRDIEEDFVGAIMLEAEAPDRGPDAPRTKD